MLESGSGSSRNWRKPASANSSLEGEEASFASNSHVDILQCRIIHWMYGSALQDLSRRSFRRRARARAAAAGVAADLRRARRSLRRAKRLAMCRQTDVQDEKSERASDGWLAGWLLM